MHPSLSLAEQERLIKLMEEAGEVVKAAAKVLQHGWVATDPLGNSYDNRKDLENELGDLRAIESLMVREDDVRRKVIREQQQAKLFYLSTVLYHQREQSSAIWGER